MAALGAATVRRRAGGDRNPGHLMHWIQQKKSHEDGQPIIRVTVISVHDGGRVEIESDDLTLTLWYHDPDRIRSALRFGGRAEWEPKYHVLYVVFIGSFNVATPDKVEACRPPIRRRPTETVRQFIERAMAENHGYTVPARWLADLDAVPDADTGEPQSRYLVGVDTPTAQERVLLRKLTEEFGGEPHTKAAPPLFVLTSLTSAPLTPAPPGSVDQESRRGRSYTARYSVPTSCPQSAHSYSYLQ